MVAGVDYLLYTRVHHHYGLNDAFDRSVTLLLGNGADSHPASAQARAGQVGGPGRLQGNMNHMKGKSRMSGKVQAATMVGSALQPSGSGRGLLGAGSRLANLEGMLVREQRHNSSHHACWHFLSCSRWQTLGSSEGLDAEQQHYRRLVQQVEQQYGPGPAPGSRRQRGVLGGGRSLMGAAENGPLLQLVHPCLHGGFNQTYRRLASGQAALQPAAVQLIGG